MTNQPDDDPAVELSSPACSMHEADDAYLGFAGRDEMLAFLNELLEAERAGARVTLETARSADDNEIAELMRTIQRDESRWCAMLSRHIKALGTAPSPNVGAFYAKAMAVGDLGERIAFLNRGQGWVVRKLGEMLPRVRDGRLHTELAEMLQSHEANIAFASEVATRAGKRDAQLVAPLVINSCFGGEKSRSGARQDTRWNDPSHGHVRSQGAG